MQINQTLNLIEKQVSSGKIDAADTSEVLQNLDETRSLLIKEKSVELENLEIVLKKLKTLDGLLEKDGKEPAEIRAQRHEFNLQAEKIKTKIASAELANAKIDEIKQFGIEVVSREALEYGRNKYNEGYLDTKERRMGHLLHHQD